MAIRGSRVFIYFILLLYLGYLGEKDVQINTFKKAAEKGNAYAQRHHGLMYDHGEIVNEDKREAVKWYGKAAKQGDAAAQYELGFFFEKGLGVLQNDAYAFLWYQKAAEQGLAKAQSKLGSMYYEGRGSARNILKAVEWYKKAAEQGDETALNNLGWMFYAQQDYANALKFYKKAADQGSGTAQYSIGMMYKNGKGMSEKSVSLAYFCFYLAFLNGKEEAKKEIDYIEGVGLFSKRQLPIDETERIKQRAQEMQSKQKKR